jgi:hypothetical protein
MPTRSHTFLLASTGYPLYLKPLPLHIPEVYELHRRRVDVEGYVCLHTNRYSVPTALIGRELEVRETHQLIRIFDGHRLIIEHPSREPGAGQRERGLNSVEI